MKESAILLSNIGNRHIKYRWEYIEKKGAKDNLFEESQLLFDEIKTEAEHIEIQILPSILEAYDIKEIYLFLTHQDPAFSQDSYYIGKIIEQILGEQYKIHIKEVNFDPRIREECFQFFEKFFKEKNNFKNQQVIVSWSGGVPAMKEALNFHTVIKNANSRIIDVDEKTHTIIEGKVQQEYLKNMDKETLKSLLHQHDYNGALTFLKNSCISSVYLEKFLNYLSLRYNFNLEKADKIGGELKCDLIHPFLETNEEDLWSRLTYHKEMIHELLHNIDISYEKGEYLAILGKIFSLQEHLIRWIFENHFQLNSEKDFDKMERINIKINIKRYPDGEDNKYVDLQALADKIYSNNLPTELKELRERLKGLEKYKKQRNHSIMAHWFGGANSPEIRELNNSLKAIAKLLDTPENIFLLLEEYFIKKLENEKL